MDAHDRLPLDRKSLTPFRRARGVVVVDGDREASEFLVASLPNTHFEVVHVSSIEGALREVRTTGRAVVVVDDDLPLVRGLDLVGRLRSERTDIESILMTRDDGVVSFATRLTVERFRCLRKPFGLADLRACVLDSVERLLRRERTLDRLTAPPKDTGEHEALRRRVEALERATHSASAAPPSVAATPTTPAPANGATPSAAPIPSQRSDSSKEISAQVADQNNLRVLVVDDDPLVRNAMARTFKRHQVTTAENGRAATEEIERSKPDIIISDLKMPEMDGIELAHQIGERWPELSSRIVFVSGTASEIERARQVAPQQPLLTKPVSNKALEQRIAEVLEAAIRRR
ncbi:MAG TPA: response regulator [Polyangiaceae bacterium]|nr:response regulator [Polyangiaceae bacterium]